MAAHYQQLLIVVLILLLNISATLQSPVAQNYSSELLRISKAAQLKAYLNVERDPCDNFYKFACGKWKRLQPAEKKKPKTAYLDQLQDLYVQKSADMLVGDRKVDTMVDIKLKDFYESCHSKESAQQLSMKPILELVDFKGGWPSVSSSVWYESSYDWLKVIAELRQTLGVNILVGLEVVPDFEDKDIHRIKVGAPQLKLGSKAAYLSADYAAQRQQYKQSIEHTLRKYFSDMPAEWAQQISDQVLEVEQELANGLPDNAELTLEQTTHQRYATDLRNAYGSYVDLNRYINIVFNQTMYALVYETPEDYMSNLVEVIKQTPKLTIANYTMWRVLESFDDAGVKNWKRSDNWCVRKVIEYFPHQLERMFHRNYNKMQMLNELQSVWTDIKKTFREELHATSLNWINIETRQRATQKLDAMDLEIITHDGEYLDEQMQGLTLRKDKYSENLINILQWKSQQHLALLLEKPQPTDSEIVVPKYQLNTNKIKIPITFLQSRFFWDAAYPNALKYGTLGFLLAQEMLHGFDTIGHKYDSHGYQNSWWDSESESSFNQRANCFVKQTTNLEFKNKKVNDVNALSTSIADNGGLHIAYLAYQKWWKNVSNNDMITTETLPLLDYTQYQIFFIGFAQLMCADYHETMENFNELPERLRLNGALANFNEFAIEFKCQSGAKMNPENKCAIY